MFILMFPSIYHIEALLVGDNIYLISYYYIALIISAYFPDFRYESNGIFVLGVGFFPLDNFRLTN